MTKQEAGRRLAEIGGQLYFLADALPELERTEEFNHLLHLVNKISYELIHGKPRDGETSFWQK